MHAVRAGYLPQEPQLDTAKNGAPRLRRHCAAAATRARARAVLENVMHGVKEQTDLLARWAAAARAAWARAERARSFDAIGQALAEPDAAVERLLQCARPRACGPGSAAARARAGSRRRCSSS